MAEFDAIKRLLAAMAAVDAKVVAENPPTANNEQQNSLLRGIGDDCALLTTALNQQLAVTTDSLISGVHFLPDTPAAAIGHKALAVNLSDLAAMGAAPKWVTLALNLERLDKKWLQQFAQGFATLASRHQLKLIGGDTCQGPLCVTVSAIGVLPRNQALMRCQAQVGDDIYVSGFLGLAGYELNYEPNAKERKALNYPEPRVELGQKLLGIANSAIDVSDGLLQDLGHILKASGKLGAKIYMAKLPVAKQLSKLDPSQRLQFALSAGDEYELCFSAAKKYRAQISALATATLPITRIGEVITIKPQQEPIQLLTENHLALSFATGFEHFKN